MSLTGLLLLVTPIVRPVAHIPIPGCTAAVSPIGLGGGDGDASPSLRSIAIDRGGERNTRSAQRFRLGCCPPHRIFLGAAGESSGPNGHEQMAFSAHPPLQKAKPYGFAANLSAFAWGGACPGACLRPFMVWPSSFPFPFSPFIPPPFGMTIDSIPQQFRRRWPRTAIEAPIMSPAPTHPCPPRPQPQAHLLPAIKCPGATSAAAAAARVPRAASPLSTLTSTGKRWRKPSATRAQGAPAATPT